MRLTTILLLITFLQVSAATFAQRVTLKHSNSSLKSVLKELKAQTGYNFLYTEGQLQKAKPVSIQVRNTELSAVLQQLFAEQPLTYELDSKTIVIREKATPRKMPAVENKEPVVIEEGQQQPIRGRVTNEKGEPLAGATVYVLDAEGKRTSVLTVADRDGSFQLDNVQEGVLLEVTFLGYAVQTLRAKAQLGTVRLRPLSAGIEEVNVVSTGYQVLPKERATGSFTTIDNETLNQQVSTDVLSRLEAVANGLVVDRGTTPVPRITVRGLSTIRGPKDALIIVDNFPYEGDIDNINPNEVEHITILKDAAAASIWGARAGNGVIVITTKKAKAEQPLTITMNSNLTIGSRPDLSYIRQMSSSDFIDVEQYLYGEGHYDSWINSTNRRALSNVVEILKSNAPDAQQQIDLLRNIDVRDDFNRYFYQRSTNQQYALSLSGGTAVAGWRASVGHDNNLSNLDASYKRTTLRLNNTYRPIKNLQILGEINYTHNGQKSGRPGYGSIIQGGGLLPYAQFADPDGNPLPIAYGHSMSYLETAGDGKLLDWKYYPLEDYKHSPVTGSTHDLLINAGGTYKLPAGFEMDVRYQHERQTTSGRTHYDQDSYYARDLVNSFTQIRTDGTVMYNVPSGGILDLSHSALSSNSFRGQLNYGKIWTRHEINALAGTEIRLTRRTGRNNRIYGYDDDILTFGTVDYRNTYPDFISGSQTYIPERTGLNDVHTNFVSSFANASYTYDQKYIFSMSGRRDASNLFGLKTNDQWNPFWSSGLGWIVSNEQFYRGKILPYLKLRATYGFSGNIDPSMSAVTTIRYVTNSPYTLSPFSQFENYYNPNLRWETSKMVNLGLDFSVKNDIIGGSIEYYRKTGDNLFGVALMDYTLGVGSSIVQNVASMKGKGIDIELKSNNLRGNLKWNSSLNVSHFREQVTDYYLSSTQGSFFVASNVPISGIVGKPVYGIYGYRWAGLDPESGDPQGYMGDELSKDYTVLTGSETEIEDLKYFGSAIPTLFGSLGNTFSYKGLSVNFSIIYKFGYYYRKRSIGYGSLFENWNGHSDYALRWQKPGDEEQTNVPSLVYPNVSARDAFYQGSEVLVEKGDHVRLQYVNLSYNINNLIRSRSPFNSLQLYVNASNLGIIWRANKSNIDPDYNYTSNALPNTAWYSVGIRAELKK